MRDDDDRYDDHDEDDAVDSAEETGIEISTAFFPMAWILLLCTPWISINGRKRRRPWGTYFFPTRPGRYEVEVWFPYLFQARCGFASRKVEVHEGEATRVGYYMWPFIFLPGSINVSHGAR